MASQEIGFLELSRLVLRSWKLIVGLALGAGLATAVALYFLLPAAGYLATARLVIQPELKGSLDPVRSIEYYRALLVSDSIVEETTRRLIDDDVLPRDTVLAVGKDLFSQPVTSGAAENGAVLTVSAKYISPEAAARIANTWIEAFLEGTRAMGGSRVEASQSALGDQLSPTRSELERLEAARKDLLDGFQKKEEEISTAWDRAISDARESSEAEIAAHQSETRQLLEALIAPPGGAAGELADGVRPLLLEIASTRAQLAQSPRVLTLEKAASDETLADLIVEGEKSDDFDRTLVSQEINPLYDELTLSVLRLESEAKRLAQSLGVAVAPVLAELEQVQLSRSATLSALVERSGTRLRTLRRRRSRALEELRRQRTLEMAEPEREIERLRDLETRLAMRINETHIATLLEGIAPVVVATPAVPRTVQRSRGILTKTVPAIFLGGVLGLMIALFRSVSGEPRPQGSG